MPELSGKQLRNTSLVLFGAGIILNALIPCSVWWYAYRVLGKTNSGAWTDWVSYLPLYVHFSLFGVAAFLILNSSAVRSNSKSAYCRYTGLVSAGIIMVAINVVLSVEALVSNMELSGLWFITAIPISIVVAFPSYLLGMLWGQWKLGELL